MDLIFYLLLSSPGMPFYSEAAQEHTFVSLFVISIYIICTNRDEVHPPFSFFILSRIQSHGTL